MFEQLGKKIGVTALATTPFALRRKLVLRKLHKASAHPDTLVQAACQSVPVYRQLWGDLSRLSLLRPLEREATQDSEWVDLTSSQATEAATYLLDRPGGPRGAISVQDMQRLGYYGLLHPETDTLVSAIRTNPAALNLVPYAGTLTGPAAERLLRFLGGQVLTLAPTQPKAVARALFQLRPSVIAGPVAPILRALKVARHMDPAAYRRVVDNLSHLIHMGSDLPMAPAQMHQVEKTLGVAVFDWLTDGVSTAMFRCRCGAFHPPPHQVCEVLSENETLEMLGQGELVLTDLTRQVGPVLRQRTGFHIDAREEGCPFFGEEVNLTPHGRVGGLQRDKDQVVGEIDVSNVVYAHGLFVDVQWRVTAKHWIVRVRPFDKDQFQRETLKAGLSETFDHRIRLEVQD